MKTWPTQEGLWRLSGIWLSLISQADKGNEVVETQLWLEHNLFHVTEVRVVDRPQERPGLRNLSTCHQDSFLSLHRLVLLFLCADFIIFFPHGGMFQSPGLLKESIYSNYRKRDLAWFCLDHMSKPGPITESGGWGTLASLDYMLGCGKGSMLLQGPWGDGKKRQFFCLFLFLPEKKRQLFGQAKQQLSIMRGWRGRESLAAGTTCARSCGSWQCAWETED